MIYDSLRNRSTYPLFCCSIERVARGTVSFPDVSYGSGTDVAVNVITIIDARIIIFDGASVFWCREGLYTANGLNRYRGRGR